jgi:hypothetical protein
MDSIGPESRGGSLSSGAAMAAPPLARAIRSKTRKRIIGAGSSEPDLGSAEKLDHSNIKGRFPIEKDRAALVPITHRGAS